MNEVTMVKVAINRELKDGDTLSVTYTLTFTQTDEGKAWTGFQLEMNEVEFYSKLDKEQAKITKWLRKYG